MDELKEPLQGQHYKMAAIIARGWAYEEEVKEGGKSKRGRLKSVCQFDTSKIFEYSAKEKAKNNAKYFDYMLDNKNRSEKIDSCISSDPKLKDGRNTVIDSLFMSHLIRQETEKILNVIGIEESFLELLNLSDNFKIQKITFLENNIKIMKDYLALQYVRNPLFYRFLIDSYINSKIGKIILMKTNNEYDKYEAILFKELTVLNDNRLDELIDFCNTEIISLYRQQREKLEHYFIYTCNNDEVNNYLGDMSCFNFNFQRFGVNPDEIQKFTDYKNNAESLGQCIYAAVSSSSFLIAIDKNVLNIEDKLKNLIYPIIKKGGHNNLVFMYSKYIICNPSNKEHMVEWIKDFFNIETLELLLIRLKEKEKNFR